MGNYLNPNPNMFCRAINSEIYVDKTELIAKTNKLINTEQAYICISRPRRFGKSMAMDMLAAYYAYGKNTHTLFDNFRIAADESYMTHLNQYNVIKINMQEFWSLTKNVNEMIGLLKK